jgi:regulator of cell morphogenesis and NO signaling
LQSGFSSFILIGGEMNINETHKIADLAIANQGATRVFEKLGIDYCCGGSRTIIEACHDSNIPVQDVLNSLEEASRNAGPVSEMRDWKLESMTSLAAYIVDKHHFYTKMELTRLTRLVAKVCDRHSANHPELIELQELFSNLKQELIPHMLKEEQVLFPYIARMEEAVENRQAIPMPFFGTVKHPVGMMSLDHDNAGELLRGIRRLANNFEPPDDACLSYKTLFKAFEDFEADLHQHIHLENNILFPRAIEFEDRGRHESAF